MKEFPSQMIPENKNKFNMFLYKRILAYMRKEIYEIVINGDENNYFEIDVFSYKYKLNKDTTDKLVYDIKTELLNLGWNVKLSFGGTGLFIYSSDKPPPSCYVDVFE